MFFKSDEEGGQNADFYAGSPAAKSGSGGQNVSMIAAGVAITGDLIGESDLRVDGSVEGKVKCSRMTIGENGSISGQLKADTVLIAGEFKGKVTTRVLTMTNTAKVDGTLMVGESLAIEAGARFEGQCQRTQMRGGQKTPDAAVHNEQFDEIKKQLSNQPGQVDMNKKAANG